MAILPCHGCGRELTIDDRVLQRKFSGRLKDWTPNFCEDCAERRGAKAAGRLHWHNGRRPLTVARAEAASTYRAQRSWGDGRLSAALKAARVLAERVI